MNLEIFTAICVTVAAVANCGAVAFLLLTLRDMQGKRGWPERLVDRLFRCSKRLEGIRLQGTLDEFEEGQR